MYGGDPLAEKEYGLLHCGIGGGHHLLFGAARRSVCGVLRLEDPILSVYDAGGGMRPA